MSDFRLPPLNIGERCYRAAIRLYPPRFRRTFALDLVETFRDERRAARDAGTPATAFWAAVWHDVIVHAAAEWAATSWRTLRRIHRNEAEEAPMSFIARTLNATELRFAVRRLWRARAFSGALLLVLSLGIGATTAVFSIVNGVVLGALPYPRPDRLVALTHSLDVNGVQDAHQSDATLLLYQKYARSFSGVAGTRPADVNLAPVNGGDRPQRISAEETTANLFDVLGVRPVLGRGFVRGEDRVGASPVAIVSYDFWRQRLAGSGSAVGTRLDVDGVSREIVGVLPPGFAYPSSDVALFVPVAFDPAHVNAGSFNYDGVARLRPGVSMEQARADLAAVLPRLPEEGLGNIPPDAWKNAHVEPHVQSLRDSIVGDASRLLWILFASVSLVLLVACANVANLFLVRGESRQLEFAVRGALGSGSAGIVAQSLSEALLLCFIGGALGVGVAALGVKLAVAAGGTMGLPRLGEVGIDARVLLFALGLSLFCAAFVSFVPLLRARRVAIAGVLRGGGRGSVAGGRQRARSILVVGQTALALVLVASSALLARSFVRLQDVRPGFDADGVVIARMRLPAATYPTAESRAAFYTALLDRVRGTPGVASASAGDWVPLSSDHTDNVVDVEDHPPAPNQLPASHFTSTVEPKFFHTLHIPILAGHTFSRADAGPAQREVIVSRAFARRYWGSANPLGKRIRPGVGGAWSTIVGEVGDVHYDRLDKPASEIVYFPWTASFSVAAFPPAYATVFARAASGAGTGAVTAAIREAVQSIDPSLPTFGEQPLSAVVSAASDRARETLLLLAIGSALALVLGAVGIYGVMAYGVSLRQREIGVRIALGAQPSRVRRMISLDGVALAAIGVAIGLAVSLGVTRFLRSLLFDVSPTDPLVLIGTSLALLAVALVASWIPARRAAAVDPADALRG